MEHSENQLKQRVQRNILIGSGVLMGAKFAAWFLTNSVGVLTDALESIVNVLAGAISLFCLYLSARPKDATHPFGHGKYELLSATVEGILILVAGGLILFEGVQRLVVPGEIRRLDLGIWIVATAGVANWLMGWYSIRVGRRYRSMALVADGRHLQSDAWSSVGLLIGLGVLYFTGWEWVDGVMALLFGGVILGTGFSILKKTTDNLLDRADVDLLREVAATLSEAPDPVWIDIHNTKIIKYGGCLHMDCDLTLPRFYTIEQGHAVGEELEQLLAEKYADRLALNVHLDPCHIFEQPKCRICRHEECPERRERFKGRAPITVKNFVCDEFERHIARK